MTTTLSSPTIGASSAASSKLDIAAHELLCALHVGRVADVNAPGVLPENSAGNAAAWAVGLASCSDIHRETAFALGFDAALRIAAIVTNDPCGPIGPAIEAELATSRKRVQTYERANVRERTFAIAAGRGDATDVRATKKATIAARARLNVQLRELASHFERQTAIVTATLADLDGDLSAAAALCDELTNRRGIVSEDAVSGIATAIGMLRGTAYIAKNGDISWYDDEAVA